VFASRGDRVVVAIQARPCPGPVPGTGRGPLPTRRRTRLGAARNGARHRPGHGSVLGTGVVEHV